jgi:glycosyltransferase involved in cell wall biosynthesis
MKLLYATSIDYPSTRANRIQVLHMAAAFSALLSKDFILGMRSTKTALPHGLDGYYVGEHAHSYTYAWTYLKLARINGVSDIFCREEKMLFFMIVFNMLWFRLPIRFWYEIHHLVHVKKWWSKYMFAHVSGIVSLTHAMKQELVSSGYPEEKILVEGDAVNASEFSGTYDTNALRAELGIPEDKHIVVYTGSIDDPWKGVGVLYEASLLLDDSYRVVIVGGKQHYVEFFKKSYPERPNFLMLGQKPHKSIPGYIALADTVVLPNSGKESISAISTSPMKLFEYMASGVPIVASDLPSIREVLNPGNAFLVEPDNAQALAKGIEAAVMNKETASALSAQALSDVQKYTWNSRAENILDFVKSR